MKELGMLDKSPILISSCQATLCDSIVHELGGVSQMPFAVEPLFEPFRQKMAQNWEDYVVEKINNGVAVEMIRPSLENLSTWVEENYIKYVKGKQVTAIFAELKSGIMNNADNGNFEPQMPLNTFYDNNNNGNTSSNFPVPFFTILYPFLL